MPRASSRGRRRGGDRRVRAARRRPRRRAGDGAGAALARRVEEAEGGDLESIHAGVDEGQEADEEELSANVVGRVNRGAGDVAAALEASDAVVSARSGRRVYQAYLEPQVCTAWLEPDGSSSSRRAPGDVRHEGRARAGVRSPAGADQVAEPLGGAFGGKFALVEPLAAGAACPPTAGAARAHPCGGLPGDEPRIRAGHASPHRRPQGRDADRDRGPHDRRPRLERRLGRGGHHVAPRRRPVPVGGPRPPRLRRPDEPVHVRRLPGPRSADRRLRARVARRAGGRAGRRPARAAPEERRRPGRRRRQRQRLPRHRRGRGPRAHARASALAGAQLAPRGRGSRRRRGLLARRGPSLRPRSAASTRTGR